jgi:hypothetical protein
MAGVSMAILGLSSPASAVVVFQDNFETAPEVSSAAPLTDSLDADPVASIGTWVLKDRNGGEGEQVTNYAPPGAHGGNNYLRLANTGDSQARAILSGSQAGDIVIDSWINTSQFDVRVFTRDAADNIGLFLSWGSGTLRYHNGSAWTSTNLSLAADTWQHLIVKPHLGSSTYDLTLDGNSETIAGYGALSEISSVLFAAGGTPPMYVDDVVISTVPEPVGIAGIALSALLVKRRRN